MLKSLVLATALTLAAAGAHAAMQPFVRPADTNIAQALVVCGPLSQWRKECQPKGPVYRHHHSHCFHHAGTQHCT